MRLPSKRPAPSPLGTLRRSAIKHRAVVDAAAASVAEDGYAATTIESIAARAGVGKQTIYRWWPSKAALFVEVYSDLVPPARLAADTGSVVGDLEALLRNLFRIYRRTPAPQILVGLIADAQSDDAAREAVASGLVVGRRDLLREPFVRGVGRGELPDNFDIQWAGDAIVALIWHRLLIDPSRLSNAFGRALVDKLVGGQVG